MGYQITVWQTDRNVVSHQQTHYKLAAKQDYLLGIYSFLLIWHNVITGQALNAIVSDLLVQFTNDGMLPTCLKVRNTEQTTLLK